MSLIDNLNSLVVRAAIDANNLNLPRADFTTTLSNIMSRVFQVVALLSVVFVAVGGIKYTLSNGDPSGLQKAKNTILYALIGLVVSVSASMILSFVRGSLI